MNPDAVSSIVHSTTPRKSFNEKVALGVRITLIFISVVLGIAALTFYFQGFSLQHVVAFGVGGAAILALTGAQYVWQRCKSKQVLDEAKLEKEKIAHKNEVLKNTLFSLAEKGSSEEIKSFFNSPEHLSFINERDGNGYPVIYFAVIRGDLELMKFLKEKGADLTVKIGEHQLSLLHEAAQEGCQKSIDQLIEWGMSVDILDKNGRTPLFHALRGRFDGIVLDLIQQKNANIRIEDNLGQTPLHIAAGCGNLELMKVLKGKGAAFDIEDKQGWNPVFRYALQGCVSEVYKIEGHLREKVCDQKYQKAIPEVLKEFGLPISTTNSKKQTLLHFAANKDIPFAIRPLRGLGIDPNIKDDQGKTAIYYATSEQVIGKFHQEGNVGDFDTLFLFLQDRDREKIRWVLEKKIVSFNDVFKVANSEGLTPFQWAIKEGYFEEVLLLIDLEKGKYVFDRSILNLPQTEDNRNILKGLLKESENQYEFKSFYELIEAGNATLVQLYLKATRSSPDHHPYLCQRNNSSVHLACKYGNLEVLKVLEKEGAYLSGQSSLNERGWEPIGTAIHFGQREIIKEFIEKKNVGCQFNGGKWELLGPTQSSNSLLWFTLDYGHSDALKEFQERGCDPSNDMITVTETRIATKDPHPLQALVAAFLGEEPRPIEFKQTVAIKGKYLIQAARKNYPLLFQLIENEKCPYETSCIHEFLIRSVNSQIEHASYFYQFIENPAEAVRAAAQILSTEKVEWILKLAGIDDKTMESFDVLVQHQRDRFPPFLVGLMATRDDYREKVIQCLPMFEDNALKAVLEALKGVWKDPSQLQDEICKLRVDAILALFKVMPEEDKKRLEVDLKEVIRAKIQGAFALLETQYNSYKDKKLEDFSASDLKGIESACNLARSLQRTVLKWKQDAQVLYKAEELTEEEKCSRDFLIKLGGQDFITSLEEIERKVCPVPTLEEIQSKLPSKNPGYLSKFNDLRQKVSDRIRGANQRKNEEEDVFGILLKLGCVAKEHACTELLGVSMEDLYKSGLFIGMDTHLIGLSNELADIIQEYKDEKVPNIQEVLTQWGDKELKKIQTIKPIIEKVIKTNPTLKEKFEKNVPEFLKSFSQVMETINSPKFKGLDEKIKGLDEKITELEKKIKEWEKKNGEPNLNFSKELDEKIKELKEKKKLKELFLDALGELKQADIARRRAILCAYIKSGQHHNVGISTEQLTLSQWVYCTILQKKYSWNDAVFNGFKTLQANGIDSFMNRHQTGLTKEQLTECVDERDDEEKRITTVSQWLANENHEDCYAQFYYLGAK